MVQRIETRTSGAPLVVLMPTCSSGKVPSKGRRDKLTPAKSAPVSCCEASGSLSQRMVYGGTSFFQRPSTRALVVHASTAVLGWVVLVGKALLSLSFSSRSIRERGIVRPL